MRLTHIRGWLLVFCLHAVIIAVPNAYFALRHYLSVVEFLPLYVGSPPARLFGAYMAGLAVLETCFVLLLVIGLKFTKSFDARTRRYWRFALPSAVLCQAGALVLAVAYAHTPQLPQLIRLTIIFSSIGLWWIYWGSRRVTESFSAGPR